VKLRMAIRDAELARAARDLRQLERQMLDDPTTARVAQLARPWLRLAGDPERIVELLDRVARQWRGIREEV